MDGAAAYGQVLDNYSKRTLGIMFRIQRECMRPTAVKDLGGVKRAIVGWEERWRRMTTELGTEAKIPDLWRMSAFLEICPKELKEQMLMRSGEIGENYEAWKNKLMSYATNRVEQSKGRGPTPMGVDYVKEYESEEWEGVIDEVWPGTQCYACGGYGHPARKRPYKNCEGRQGQGQRAGRRNMRGQG